VDASLVRAAQGGDRDAFAGIAAALGRPFLATARRILHDLDLAEDATQNALVAIWRGLPMLRDGDRFEAWAYRLLLRACYAEHARRRRSATNIRALPIHVPSPVDDVAAVINRDELDRAFRRLSFDQRAALVLRYYLDLPLAEVAATLGVPEGTASSRLHYAIQALQAGVEADARPAAESVAR
jgi:RNA polymerase sigma-70 factor, ECF subfamily